MTEEQVVREVFRAYAQRDRAAIEALVAPDFLFVSPLDHEIDRDKYFELCWPNSEEIQSFDLVHMATSGEVVFVTYEGVGRYGKRFRNTEVHTVRDGLLRRVEVYFGWNVPHPVPQGEHRELAANA
jgi:ketosteroid isomerase-like protein